MNKNEARILLAQQNVLQIKQPLCDVLGHAGNNFAVVRDQLQANGISQEQFPRLYSDLSSCCVQKAALDFPWNNIGMASSLEMRGAYSRVKLTGDSFVVFFLLAGNKIPNYVKEALSANSIGGVEGQRVLLLEYSTNDDRFVASADLVVRDEKARRLASFAVFPQQEDVTVTVS